MLEIQLGLDLKTPLASEQVKISVVDIIDLDADDSKSSKRARNKGETKFSQFTEMPSSEFCFQMLFVGIRCASSSPIPNEEE